MSDLEPVLSVKERIARLASATAPSGQIASAPAQNTASPKSKVSPALPPALQPRPRPDVLRPTSFDPLSSYVPLAPQRSPSASQPSSPSSVRLATASSRPFAESRSRSLLDDDPDESPLISFNTRPPPPKTTPSIPVTGPKPQWIRPQTSNSSLASVSSGNSVASTSSTVPRLPPRPVAETKGPTLPPRPTAASIKASYAKPSTSSFQTPASTMLLARRPTNTGPAFAARRLPPSSNGSSSLAMPPPRRTTPQPTRGTDSLVPSKTSLLARPINPKAKQRFEKLFVLLLQRSSGTVSGTGTYGDGAELSGRVVREVWLQSGLSKPFLRIVWYVTSLRSATFADSRRSRCTAPTDGKLPSQKGKIRQGDFVRGMWMIDEELRRCSQLRHERNA